MTHAAKGPLRSPGRLLLELGHGGMGTVYLVLAEGPGGFRKLKVVKRLRANEDPALERMFLDEARLSARLHHPNIVQTNEVGFDGRHHFLVMEYLDGQPLDAILRRARTKKILPVELAVFVATQILAGLGYAHELAGTGGTPLAVVHRDVSPHNVLVTYDGAVKVIDFGIAKVKGAQSVTKSGVLKGKATYMAPEQAAHEAVDRRADLFAVGAILWESITGERLWEARDEGEILARLRAKEVPVPSARDGVPAGLVAICGRALAPHASERFASAAEMQAALEPYQGNVGSRELGPLVAAWFTEERAAIAAELDEQLRGAEADARPSPVAAASEEKTLRTQMTATHTDPWPSSAPKVAPARPVWPRVLVFGALFGLSGLVAARAVAPARSAPVETHAAAAPAAPRPSLASEDCRVLAEPGDESNPDTLWIGAMFPRTGAEAASFGDVSVNALELARRDFASVSRGLPNARAGGPPRPIGLVVCDDAMSPERAARHLVDDLHVPAIIGFRRSKELIDLAGSLFLPRGTLAVAAINTSALLTSIPHPAGSPRMIWRTTLSTARFAPAVARIVSDVWEPVLRAAKSGPVPAEPIRVASVRTGNASGLAFADGLFGALRFNGKSVLENGKSFSELVYDDPGGDDTADYAGLVAHLVALRPHVVVFADPGYFVPRILPALEAAWPSGAPRPRYASFGILQGDALARALSQTPGLRSRILTVEMQASLATNAKLAMRYNEMYSPKVTLSTAPGVTYDALYLTAYAAYATGDDHPTGASLARAMPRLQGPGVSIDVGPAKIFDALRALDAGGAIDLNGAATRLDFDLETGEPTASLAVYCVGRAEAGSPAESVESGAVYDPRADALVGTPRCR